MVKVTACMASFPLCWSAANVSIRPRDKVPWCGNAALEAWRRCPSSKDRACWCVLLSLHQQARGCSSFQLFRGLSMCCERARATLAMEIQHAGIISKVGLVETETRLPDTSTLLLLLHRLHSTTLLLHVSHRTTSSADTYQRLLLFHSLNVLKRPCQASAAASERRRHQTCHGRRRIATALPVARPANEQANVRFNALFADPSCGLSINPGLRSDS